MSKSSSDNSKWTFPIDIDSICSIMDFCVSEIALEGLEGCRLTDLFNLLYKSSQSLINKRNENFEESPFSNICKLFGMLCESKKVENESEMSEIEEQLEYYKNYLWKLLVSQFELDFYLENVNEKANTSSQPAVKATPVSKLKISPNNRLIHIVNDKKTQTRGFCVNYSKRTCINNVIKTIKSQKFKDIFNEYNSRLIVVANQHARNRALCPSYKCLDYEDLNDLEYCILEAIGKTRFNGMYSTGDTGLTQFFSLAPKQLHYVLVILESMQLIKRQVLSSEKKKSIIFLKRYAFKHLTQIENVCNYLMKKHLQNGSGYIDTFTNIKAKLGLNNKQFKTLMQTAEKQNYVKRCFKEVECRYRKSRNPEKYYTKMKQIRMVKLTDSYFKMLASQSLTDESGSVLNDDDITEMNDTASVMNETTNDDESLKESVGIEQSCLLPMHSQIFAKIEECGREGISLKKLGTLFGFDFYKSRRIGSNLQAHPEIVTLIKESSTGKAKYQTIVLRKFLSINKNPQIEAGPNEVEAITPNTNEKKGVDNQSLNQSIMTNDSINSNANTSLNISQNDSFDESNLMILKKEGLSHKTIQALMVTQRAQMRKKLVLDYLNKHQICTKYEITREIRTFEAQEGLKGCIDSKTAKRMLTALETEKKLNIFFVNLKNVSYMCVKKVEIKETDDLYINYCSTFKRTFDSVDSKYKDDSSLSSNNLIAEVNSKSPKRRSVANEDENKTEENKTKDTKKAKIGDNAETNLYSQYKDEQDTEKNFRLTRPFVNSIVSKLKFIQNYSKVYSLTPKIQKAIILHRFLNYLLFFYDGQIQSELPGVQSEQLISTTSAEIKLELPPLNKTYQHGSASWKTYIPPLNRTKTGKSIQAEENCIFIGEIFSHMPLSIFCSIIVINHQIPGLVSILKNLQTRHILVKDLPPDLLAPLIFERRYLQRMLGILHLLGCLGLITFVQSPCRTNQAINRDVQQQLIYVHRKAKFFDTTANKASNWNDLKKIRDFNFQNNANLEGNQIENENKKLVKYEECYFEFNKAEDIVEYWQKLVHVSMNTYKFSITKYLHENKKLRQALLNKITSKANLDKIKDLWPIEDYGDKMGPGCYDSQLFLNSFKNWMLPSNVSTLSSMSCLGKKLGQSEPAITKEDDQSCAPYSELALVFPFGVFRGIESTSSEPLTSSSTRKSKRNSKKKRLSDEEDSMDNSDGEQNEFMSQDSDDEKEKKKKKAIIRKTPFTKSSQSDKQSKSKRNMLKSSNKSFKQIRAKNLLDKARNFKLNTGASSNENNNSIKKLANHSHFSSDKRAIWHQDEDEMILLIKVTSLYFLPKELLPLKLMSDIMNAIMPTRCLDKRISSFGRRLKMLLKSKMNLLFVSNKLELCKQNKDLERMFAKEKLNLKRNIVDKEQVDLYIKFINEIKERFLRKRDYETTRKTSPTSNESNNEMYNCEHDQLKIDLPSTLDEFHKKYTIRNTSKDILMKNQSNFYQQPTTDYEISCNTLHSAIHSSILINDKNPRVYESFNLFDKYSDQLLSDVIARMSKHHKIIAPTKCSELKKKNVTAFSKHIGKAYHISQRYQYKWTSNISSNVLTETKQFKDTLVEHKIKQQMVNQNADMVDEFTDKDDLGMTSFLAHTIDNPSIQVQIDVPNKIWVSKLI